MTDFEVGYANGVLSSYAGEAARYEINPQSGVLTVFDGDGKRFHFSPAGWASVSDDAPDSVPEPRSEAGITRHSGAASTNRAPSKPHDARHPGRGRSDGMLH